MARVAGNDAKERKPQIAQTVGGLDPSISGLEWPDNEAWESTEDSYEQAGTGMLS